MYLLSIPFEPIVFGIKLNVHLILEYLAFFLGYRYYIVLKQRTDDRIIPPNRLSIILGASIGALIGSRCIGLLEHPIRLTTQPFLELINSKTIMGGLFGGLLGVELAKKIIGETKSSGDLFTLPIVLGIFIGRIGCFLSGIKEFTYGKTTTFFMGMDLGDGVKRHPLALYELVFLVVLFLLLKTYAARTKKSGAVFKVFMLSYFGFRFCIEFLKPNQFFILGFSTIQLLCVACFVYYNTFIIQTIKHAR